MSEDKPKRPKFKWTKELVNIALNDGMTQEQIGRVCRVEQSVVSAWKNGKYKATEQQLAELLRRYGARLNRTTARVYLVYEEPTGTWQETEIGQRLIELVKRRDELAVQIDAERKAAAEAKSKSDEEKRKRLSRQQLKKKAPKQAVPPSLEPDLDLEELQVEDDWRFTDPAAAAEHRLADTVSDLRRQIDPHSEHPWRLDQLVEFYQDEFVSKGRQRLVQAEGPILFRYTFFRPIKRLRHRQVELGREPIGRWLIHDLQRGKLLLVAQSRRSLRGFGRERWTGEVHRVLGSSHSTSTEPVWVDCPDDAGRWISFLRGPFTAEELLQHADRHIRRPTMAHNPHDELVLPYLVRKALVEHGHPVTGIDRITSSE